MLGVVKLVPVAKLVPPVAFSNQLIVPKFAVADNVILPESQRLFGIVAVIIGVAFTVAITAVLGDVQLPVVAST